MSSTRNDREYDLHGTYPRGEVPEYSSSPDTVPAPTTSVPGTRSRSFEMPQQGRNNDYLPTPERVQRGLSDEEVDRQQKVNSDGVQLARAALAGVEISTEINEQQKLF